MTPILITLMIVFCEQERLPELKAYCEVEMQRCFNAHPKGIELCLTKQRERRKTNEVEKILGIK